MSNPSKKPVPAVAAVIVDGERMLLVKRGCEPSKGKWATPGGRVEWGETLVEAIRREVREETGLEVEVGAIAGVFDLMASGADGTEYHYIIIEYFAHPIGGELVPGDDASDVRWVDINDLDNYDLTFRLRERLAEMGIRGD